METKTTTLQQRLRESIRMPQTLSETVIAATITAYTLSALASCASLAALVAGVALAAFEAMAAVTVLHITWPIALGLGCGTIGGIVIGKAVGGTFITMVGGALGGTLGSIASVALGRKIEKLIVPSAIIEYGRAKYREFRDPTRA